MLMLKFHEYQEFHDFRLSKKLLDLRVYLRKLYDAGEDIVINEIQLDFYQVLIDGEEVGFIGKVEVL